MKQGQVEASTGKAGRQGLAKGKSGRQAYAGRQRYTQASRNAKIGR
jgi:hypothetical protein